MKGALSWPFMRLYLLTVLYFCANAILNVIIPLKGGSLGASNAVIGIVMGAYLFTTMLLRPWAGHIIRKQGPIAVLRSVLALNAIALALYAFTGLEGYFAARVLQGVCTAFFSMALQLGLIDALPDEERSQGISMYSLCATMPGIVGPLLAIGLWEADDPGLLAAVLIGLGVITGAVGFSARVGNSAAAEAAAGWKEGKPLGGGVLQWFGELVRHPQLLRCSLLMLGASVIFGAATTFIPLYAAQVSGASAAVYLMLQAGTVVAARFWLRKRIPSDGQWHPAFMRLILLCLAAAALCVGLAAHGGGALFYAGAFLMGIAQAMVYPTLTTYLSFVLPKESRNILMGLFIAMADLGVSLGAIAMGPVADLTSYSAMYMFCAAIGASLLLVSAREARSRRANSLPV
ncbi:MULTISPECIES: MFS transporter [unclassified Paenibacillus]|uniref:staphylopine family metallophore export MFS transporter CntE n=1 Tax=unclassified Paenibacillus TaxID=185978 RepID=UPI000955707D|nr:MULTISPECIES: MFS transporter [unclassified Paenibacillus]ASS65374.1 MFS transporter [Paenibacillus sp. RUD330]SIQ38343.1 Predicted arabinose efflux permease, MFS family [Paenibacillus sp. RU4X]SIQ60529.1 Predicted arabinose efflux permease, MFS family [Paenibacillus sp. RU4T]